MFVTPLITYANILEDGVAQMFKGVAYIAYYLTGVFLKISGWFLDTMIRYALDSTKLTELTVINDIWAIIRDLANMFFIFILLYIAIGTILRLSRVQWKQALANLIIVALLINFSFFFTRVIIDASNVLAVGFYNNISVTMKTGINATKTVYGPSSIVMQSARLSTFFDSLDPNKDLDANKQVKKDVLTPFTRGVIYLAASLFQAVTGFVFISGGILFLIRFVSFIFLLILSPLAFVGMILQSTRSMSSEWWSKLLSYSFVAPAYLGMVYIVSRIISSPEFIAFSGVDESSFLREFKDPTAPLGYAMIMNFLIVTAMMWGALAVSQRIAGGMTGAAMGYAKRGLKTTGSAAAGASLMGGAIMGRQIGGRIAKEISNIPAFKKMAAEGKGVSGKLASTLYSGVDSAARSTWDVRNTAVGGAVVGGIGNQLGIKTNQGKNMGKGGYLQQGGVVTGGTDREKKYVERQAELADRISVDADGTELHTEDKEKKVQKDKDIKQKEENYKFQKKKLEEHKARTIRFQGKDKYKQKVADLDKTYKTEMAQLKARSTDSKQTTKEAFIANLVSESEEKPQSWKPNGFATEHGDMYQERAKKKRAAVKRIKHGMSKKDNQEKLNKGMSAEERAEQMENLKALDEAAGSAK